MQNDRTIKFAKNQHNLQKNFQKHYKFGIFCIFMCMKICKSSSKKTKVIFAIFVAIFLIFCYFEFYVNPQICSANISKIKGTTIQIENEAISKTLQNNDYDDLIAVKTDSDGNVAYMQVNSNNVNKLNADILTKVQSNLNSQSQITCMVPLGNFSGVPVLSGIGPNVRLKVVPIGNVQTKYVSQFFSVGINQSLHKIMLQIQVEVCILLPAYTQNIIVSNQVVVAESVIVGKIPSTYLNTDNLTNALNLIP